jgi:hypothetical protein
MTTKAARIIKYGEEDGLTTRDIAMLVYDLTDQSPPNKIEGAMAYVRVVLWQRMGRGESPADIRWRKSPSGRQICNRKNRTKRQRRATNPTAGYPLPPAD